MTQNLNTGGRRKRRRWHAAANAVLGRIAVALMRLLRHLDRARTASVSAATLRRLGPWLPEHRVGRANLAAAFPDKSAAEIETILAGVWDNLGRVAVEYLHLDRLTISIPDPAGDADVVADETIVPLRDAFRTPAPRLIFAAHLGNWEIPAMAAHAYGFDTTILYRPPDNPAVRAEIIRIREACMGTLVASMFDAPILLGRALERSSIVAMLIDQHEMRGVDVTFFGRQCKASPLLAKLARHYDCQIHGVRVVRLPDRNRFRFDLTGPVEPARDAEGKIDVAGTTQRITSVVESWVRENPDQWLWLHRRWR